MSAEEVPTLVSLVAEVRCACGEVTEFDEIADGWTHFAPCEDCGRQISVQADMLLQYEKERGVR